MPTVQEKKKIRWNYQKLDILSWQDKIYRFIIAICERKEKKKPKENEQEKKKEKRIQEIECVIVWIPFIYKKE